MPRLASVDGRIMPLADAAVPIEDRGFQFADSIYEVVAVLNGRALDWPLHLDRLRRNLAALHIDPPLGDAALTLRVRRLLAANRARDALLYLQVTRGSAKRDHGFPDAATTTLVMTVRPFDFAQRIAQQREGVACTTVTDHRWGRCDIKTTALLANVLAKQDARTAGGFEAIFVRDDGIVTEGGSTNVWMVDAAGTLVTHPLSGRILPGVARATALRLAATAQLKTVQRPFTLTEVDAARELILTSTTVPVLPVVRLDGRAIADGRPGPVATRLAGLMWDEIARQTGWRAPA